MDSVENIKEKSKPLLTLYYTIRIPYLQSTSIEYMRQIGTYSSGDKDIDKALINQWITTMMTISKMVEYYQNGVQIRIVKESDVVEIYNYVNDFLYAWVDHMNNAFHNSAPVEQLMAMERFANDIYDHAKYTPSKPRSNIFGMRPLVNRDLFFKQDDVPKDIPERASLSDFLKEHLYNMKRW